MIPASRLRPFIESYIQRYEQTHEEKGLNHLAMRARLAPTQIEKLLNGETLPPEQADRLICAIDAPDLFYSEFSGYDGVSA